MRALWMVAALVLPAFAAGLFLHKIKTSWCADCGAVKSCPRCAAWAFTASAGDPMAPSRRAGRRGRLRRRNSGRF